jgi:hypothetical protein
MSKSIKDKLLNLTSARYKHLLPAINNFNKTGDDVLGTLLRVHLTSESILEELIHLTFEDNAQAILKLKLTYRQKLELVASLKICDDWPLIPEYIVGSLRKLNKLRNDLAHQLNATLSNDQVVELFMGEEQVYGDMRKDDIHINLQRYAFFILGNILPKFEEIDGERNV